MLKRHCVSHIAFTIQHTVHGHAMILSTLRKNAILIGVVMRQWLRSPRDPLCLESVFTSKIAQTTHRHARLLMKHFSNHILNRTSLECSFLPVLLSLAPSISSYTQAWATATAGSRGSPCVTVSIGRQVTPNWRCSTHLLGKEETPGLRPDFASMHFLHVGSDSIARWA